jgi:hypothetical protein
MSLTDQGATPPCGIPNKHRIIRAQARNTGINITNAIMKALLPGALLDLVAVKTPTTGGHPPTLCMLIGRSNAELTAIVHVVPSQPSPSHVVQAQANHQLSKACWAT